jgi:hypothetical protein
VNAQHNDADLSELVIRLFHVWLVSLQTVN